jgi:hypothetical protein
MPNLGKFEHVLVGSAFSSLARFIVDLCRLMMMLAFYYGILDSFISFWGHTQSLKVMRFYLFVTTCGY